MLHTRLNLEESARIIEAKVKNIMNKPVMKVLLTVEEPNNASVVSASASDTEENVSVEADPSFQCVQLNSSEPKSSLKVFDVSSNRKDKGS
jgi:hypothetical protein